MEALQPRQLRWSRSRGRPGRESARLLEDLRSGDRSAAETLVERTYERVFASLCRLSGDRDLAADLTQETYARAWRSLDSFQSRCRFSTWLYRIAYTTFLNHIRRPQRLQEMEEGFASSIEDPGIAPDEEAAGRIDGHRLRRAVMRLPEELRFTVTCRFWGDMPVREIALAENVSTVAIRKRMKRALHHLRVALEEEAS